MTFSILELFNYSGALLGIILSIILLTKTKGTPAFRISFAWYLILASLIVTLGTIIFTGKILFLPHLLQIDSPLHYLYIPINFFVVISYFKPGFKFKSLHIIHFLPFIINVLGLIPFYMESVMEKRVYYEDYIQNYPSKQLQVHSLIILIIAIVYFIMQLYVFNKYNPKKNISLSKQQSTIIWFRIFFTGEGVLIAVLLFERLSGYSIFPELYKAFILSLSVFLYFLALSLLFFPELLYNNQVVQEQIPVKDKYERSKLNADSKNIILDKLDELLNREEKPYLNPRISLNEVSLLLEISINQLSQVINEKTGLNFNDYINKYRINEAKMILLSPQYQKLTIEAIAKMAGFNSKSAFYAAFKKHSGMTPKEFIKMI